MKPVISQRTTQCYYCKEMILPGQRRLTDVLRIRRDSDTSNKPKLIRRHFHFQSPSFYESDRSCFDLMSIELFDKMDDISVKTNNPNGRPSLNLCEDDQVARNTLMRSIHHQIDYYLIKGNLRLDTPVYINDVSIQDIRRAKRFRANMVDKLTRLSGLGGIPKQYEEYYKSFVTPSNTTTGISHEEESEIMS